MSERLEPGAEAARRNDLAIEAAQAWRQVRKDRTVREVLPGWAREALDRLAEAYDFNQHEEQR